MSRTTEIWSFIAKDNPEAATWVIEAAKATFKALAQNPSLGNIRRFHDQRLCDIRSWRVSGFEKYVIFYRISSVGIEVLHVYHAARVIDALFAKE